MVPIRKVYKRIAVRRLRSELLAQSRQCCPYRLQRCIREHGSRPYRNSARLPVSEGHLHYAEGPDGKIALRLDYDFHGGGGFIAARKKILFKLPLTFDLRFSLRGEGPPNNFEFKVIDPGGADTWRHLREDIQLPLAGGVGAS